MSALISLRNIQLSFGVAPILDGVDFHLNAGECVCLIGRNGEGKSTLLKLINQNIQPDSGEINITGGLKVAMLAQDVPQKNGRVADIVMQGVGEVANVLADYHKASDACATGDMAACERMSELQIKLDDNHGWDIERQAESIIAHMGLNPDDDISSLSGGRKRRVLLAQALIAKPDILLLDEPTNHLDVASIEWLENYLLSANLTLLFITHDRAFVDKLSTRIVELDRGKLRSYDVSDAEFKGNGYARYLDLKQQQLEAEEKANANFDKKLAEEEAWIRQGIKARRTRNEGRVRALKSLRNERKARREQVGDINISMTDAEKSGKLVFKVKNLSLSYETDQEFQQLVKGFTTTVMRGDKIGIVGDNGVGKTTLIKAILGELGINNSEKEEQLAQAEKLKASLTGVTKSGSVKLGTNLEIAFFDQLRDQLDLEQSVAYNVSAGSDYVEVGGRKKHILGYLQDFLFAPERSRTPVKALSGGERNRVLLAKQLLKPANVLVLDEPTNDLDMATLELLEEAVTNFNGTILLISHDRAFMDNVVTSTWVFDGKGDVQEYVGGYQDYLRQANRQTAYDAPNHQSVDKKQEKPEAKATSDKPSQKSKPEANIKKKKLSYKEQRELDALPEEIAALEAEQETLQQKLADGSWFTEDAQAAAEGAERLAELDEILLEKLERWTELES